MAKYMRIKEHAFKNGDEFPALSPGKVRIYSMRFCHYAHRVRLVLLYKNIPHEIVNINLREKPSWFLERTPMGLVPVLEHDDKIIYESSICAEYLDAAFPGPSLIPSDPYTRARHAIIIAWANKADDLTIKIYKATEKENPHVYQQFNSAVQVLEDSLEGQFFGGDKIQMVDLHLWCLFERWYGTEGLTDPFPKLQAWVALMLEQPVVKATAFSPEMYKIYTASYFRGKAEYDLGLD